MQITAKAKAVQMSARKVRLVADVIRNKSANDALATLQFLKKRGSSVLNKVLHSAIANASHNAKLKADNLFIKQIQVTDGVAYKRFHPSTRGRIHPYKKRTSHITIVLEEKNGTKN